VNGHIERGLIGEINAMGVADRQEELNPPTEVDDCREPKFIDEVSNKIELISVLNRVKYSCGNIFKYDVVSNSDYWPGKGFMVNRG